MFPPIAGSGIQRSLKFIKYLPDFGIEPIVFAPDKAFWKAHDPKNLELPFLKQTRIYRCGIRKLRRYYDLRFKKGQAKHPHFYFLALKYIWFIDFFSSWYFECRKTALEIGIKEQVDGIFTTSPPHSVHLFGAYLQKKLGKPWVMDLRDAMVDDPNKSLSGLSKELNFRIETFYEKKFYASSTAITTVSQPIIDTMKSRHKDILLEKKAHIITNGFDTSDYDGLKPGRPAQNKMRITYTGAFLAQHTPQHFLQAVKNLIDQKKIDPEKLLLRFMGYFDSRNMALFSKFSDDIPIKVLPFQPHKRVLQYQIDSDLLLLIVSLSVKEGGNQIFTGKFFEYLGAKRPIFALVPEGPLKRTIEDGRFGVVVAPKDIAGISHGLMQVYNQWRNDFKIPYNGNLELRSSFTRKKLTEKLAGVFTEKGHI